MWRRFFLLTIRNLKRHLLYSSIVIGGLALGITTFLVIIQWGGWHLSFDKHFKEGDSIYRLSILESKDNFERHTARILHGDIVKQLYNESEIPEIKRVARMTPFRNAIVRKDNIIFYEEKSYSCDPSFLQLFNAHIIQGDQTNPLDGPYKVILSEETARKYFGNEDPIGQSIEISHQFASKPDIYEISGIYKQFPKNTHFKVELLTSLEDPTGFEGTAWVYLKLDPSADIQTLTSTLDSFIKEHNSEEYASGLNPVLIPVNDIHLKSHLPRELEKNVQYQTLIVLFIAGILVFVLAWFNFTLLSISQNQLAIKRLIYQWQSGAGKKSFFLQFLVEYMSIGFIAFILSIGISLVLNKPIESTFGVSLFQNTGLLIISLLIIALILIASSFLTSFYATRRLFSTLKQRFFAEQHSKYNPVSSRNWFIRAVIVIEFIITYVLLSNLYMIRSQVEYAVNQQIGSGDKNSIQIPQLARPVINQYDVFRDELLKYPVFEEVTAMMEEPGGMAMDAFKYTVEGLPETDSRLFVFPVDENFIRFYDLKILAGSDLPLEYDRDDTTEYYLLNETAAKMLPVENYEDLVGRELKMDFPVPNIIYPGEIAGIIEDFHLSDMQQEVNPMVVFPEYTWLYCFSLKIKGDEQEALKILRKVWDEIYPDYPLRYFYTTEIYDQLYETEYTELEVLFIFSILSMLIAGTGLFALSGFFMQEKMHAAAIRKISGASISQILIPELTHYIILALISSAVALPVSYLTMNRWLSNFTYQVAMPYPVFIYVTLILITFSWISVMYHSLRLAHLKPSEFIRNR